MSVEQIKNSANIKRTTITIDTAFKTSGTNTNFSYTLNNSISDVRLIEITNMEVNNDAYNINDRQNTFNWTDSLGTTHDTTLVNDNHSMYTLARTIQDDMNTQKTEGGFNHIVKYNGTGTVTFTSYLGITPFDLNFSINPNTNLASVFGFAVTDFTGTTTYSGSEPLDLVYTKNIFIGSTNLMLNAFDKSEISNGSTHVLTKMELEADYGDILYYDKIVPIRSSISSLTAIDIRLTDDANDEVELENGKFKITLDIYSRIFNNGFSI